MALYNLRNPAVKRLMKEAEELSSPTDEYHAQPLEDNLFEWHFTLRGPPNTDYDGGIYHGRISLPPDYPMKPPSIILLTPNGRFEINKKICLSISGHHPESWQPSWSIRTALLAIIGFMPTHGNGAIGSLDYTPEERKELALKSQEWKCPECGDVQNIFKKNEYHTSKEETTPTPSIPVYERDLSQPSPLSQPKNSSLTSIDNTVTKLPNISVSNVDHSNTSTDAATSSVYHRRVVTNQAETCKPKLTNPAPSNSNVFHTICMWVIVIAIAILCMRRLFSL